MSSTPEMTTAILLGRPAGDTLAAPIAVRPIGDGRFYALVVTPEPNNQAEQAAMREAVGQTNALLQSLVDAIAAGNAEAQARHDTISEQNAQMIALLTEIRDDKPGKQSAEVKAKLDRGIKVQTALLGL